MSPVLMVGLLQQVSAQDRSISGRVTDRQTGEGLPGVTVLLKGTTNGVSTNSDGTFTLSAPATGGILVFSSVGFVQQERAIGSESQINIGLGSDTKALSEVVVTGYGGSQDVKDITGSQSRVTEEKLLNQPVQSFDQALTGRAAGVQITNPGGTLADGVAIRIRGVNSLSNSSQPLFVVDGVPLNALTNANVFNGGNGTRYNPLADINPNDIQSIDVLKDAAAAAIYGSRASNGVILITTKRGKAGQNRLSFNSYVGFQEPTRVPDLLNGDDFITIQNEKAANANAARPTQYPTAVIARDIDVDGDGVPDRTNWMDQIFQKGLQQDYQVALSGGTELANYYASGNWTDQKGILTNNRLRRGSARLNVDVTPKKWLKGGVSSSYSKTLNNGLLTDGYLAGVTLAGYNAPPNLPIYNPDGTYYLNSAGNLGNGNNLTQYVLNNYNHPVAVTELQRNNNTTQRILANGYLTIEPLAGLKFTSKIGIDYFDNFEDQYSSPLISGLGRSYNGLVQDNRLDQTLWNWQNYANYDKTFGELHTVNLTAGVEYQEEKQRQIYTPAENFVDPKYKDILDGLYAGTFIGGGSRYARGFQSYFGRANYSFANKYYASFTIRNDADSRFGVANQRGTFPAGSVAWRISEENFMDPIDQVGDLKVRASYGLVGNSSGIGNYASVTTIGGGQYADVNGLSITQVGNPSLQWETSKKFDIGLDLSVLKDRIGFTFDWYNTRIDGLLLNAPVLLTTGLPGGSVSRNVGEMYNRGVEASFNTVNVRLENGFSWTSQLNFSVTKNRVIALATPTDLIQGVQRAGIGKSVAVYYLPEWAGVNSDNGNAQFYDKDGNIKQYNASTLTWSTLGGEPTTAIGAADFKYTKKSGYPTMYGGFDNTFAWKGLELGVFLQYSGGNLIYNATRAGLLTNSLNNNLNEIKDRWTQPGDQTDIPKLVLQDNISTQASTRWLEKGDFLRLRQVRLGYNLPKQVLTTLGGLNNVNVYVLVQNAYVFTGYKGTDPEVNSNRNTTTGNIGYGIDNRSVPQPRSYTFGVNIGI